MKKSETYPLTEKCYPMMTRNDTRTLSKPSNYVALNEADVQEASFSNRWGGENFPAKKREKKKKK